MTQTSLLSSPPKSVENVYAEWEQVAAGALSERFVREPYQGQKVVAVGEAPGEEEDQKGLPFVGPAGREFDSALANIGMPRSSIHVLNIVPRRPSGNRTPTVKERGLHGRFAKDVVRAIKPDLIILLGGVAAREFLGAESIGAIRGSPRDWEDWKAIATWHPSSILQIPSAQTKARRRGDLVQDLRTAKGLLEGSLQDASSQIDTVPITESFLQRCREAQILSVDLETNDRTDWWHPACHITHIALWGGSGPAGVSEWVPTLGNACRGLLEAHTGIVGHNYTQFDRPLLGRYGINTPLPVVDTQLLSYAVDENPPHDLQSLAVRHLNLTPWKHMKGADIQRYAGIDVYATHRLAEVLVKLVDGPSQRIYDRILIPLADALARVSGAGMLVDPEALMDLSDWIDRNFERCERILRAIVPGDHNLSSDDQVAEILYGRMGLKPPKKTPTGKRGAVDEEALQVLAAEAKDKKARQFCRILLRRSSTETSRNKYVTAITEAVGWDGRVRSSYRADGTETGRTTASAPSGGPGINAQQIDRRPLIRNLFAAPEGKVLIARDYSQIEPRFTAWLSGDERMIDLFRKGGDIYLKVGSLLFDKPSESVSQYERQVTKSAALAMSYKQSIWGLRNYLAKNGMLVDEDEASRLWHSFHRAFPRIRKWHEKVEAEARKTGLAYSPFGRKRFVPEAMLEGEDTETRKRRAKALRELLNHPIQSGARELTAMSIIILDKKMDWDRAKIIQDGHDALLFEVPEDEVDFWVGLTGEVMDNPPTKEWFGVEIPVPIVSEAKVGRRWGSLVKTTARR